MLERKFAAFTCLIKEFYTTHKRSFPWRETNDPYKILVSEFMLQQTQTLRVVPKYEQFCLSFPAVEVLANSSLAELLIHWQGLGYNRRAQYLHQTARCIVMQYEGIVPRTVAQLETLPGIGPYTAGAIAAFAYKQPTIFIETNIRTVFIETFFAHAERVSDAKILPLIKKTLDTEDPRHWYYALMDYGAYLKSLGKRTGTKSKHYLKQSKFEGSRRQVRGAIIRALTQQSPQEFEDLKNKISDARFESVLQELAHEKLVAIENNTVSLG